MNTWIVVFTLTSGSGPGQTLTLSLKGEGTFIGMNFWVLEE